jgi:predicted ArsR family transcriptional regulator
MMDVRRRILPIHDPGSNNGSRNACGAASSVARGALIQTPRRGHQRLSDLSKRLGLPRSNVRRCLEALIGEGVIRKEGEHGYRGELDWLASRIDAEYFLKIRDAIITAADELKALEHTPGAHPPDEASGQDVS